MCEMCSDVCGALKEFKLGVIKEANTVALEHTDVQCQAMIGKLEYVNTDL